jgi:hypothetical protein
MGKIKESKVARRYSVNKRTLVRWDGKPELAERGWPPPEYINGQRYRDSDKLDAFDAACVRASALERHGKRHELRVAHAKSASEVASKARQMKLKLAAQPATEAV